MILNSILNAKKILAFVSVVIFFVLSCNDTSQKDQFTTEKTVENSTVSEFTFNKQLDSLQVYYRQYQLIKLAKCIYNIEPKLKENSYEMGVLVYYKGLLFEEINDHENYQLQENKLKAISQNLKVSPQKFLLDYYVLENQIADSTAGDRAKLEPLLLKSLDTLQLVKKKYRDENFYFRIGNATYLLSEFYIDHQDLKTAEYYTNLTLNYMDSTKVEYNRVYPFYLKGLILANQKKPQEALQYYHKIVELAQKNHATRFLRNIYPAMNTSYNELGNFEFAANYMLKYKMTNDTILKAQKQAADFVTIKENELAQKADRRKIIMIVLSILVLFTILYFARKKMMNRKPKVEQNAPLALSVTDSISPENLHELVELSKTNENVFYLKFPDYKPLLVKDLSEFQPKLSDSELKFCMYLSMKYTVKEIAIYTNTSIKSVEGKKYRIKKKINTPEYEELAKRLNL